MRKSIIAAITALLTLALAVGALATDAFKQVSKVTFTTHHAGASTGITMALTSTDAGAPGSKPTAAKRIVMTFPAGTRFNLRTSVSRVCTLSDAQLKQPFAKDSVLPPMCPKASQVGRGTALLNTMPTGIALTKLKPPLFATVRATVYAWVHSGNQLIFLLRLNPSDLPGQPPPILHAYPSGNRLTIDVPRLVYGKKTVKFAGTTLKFAGVTGTIVSLKLRMDPSGTGSSALVRAGACAGGKFAVKSHFTYRDHSQLLLTSRSRCSR